MVIFRVTAQRTLSDASRGMSRSARRCLPWCRAFRRGCARSVAILAEGENGPAAHPLSRGLTRRCIRRSLGPGWSAAPERLRLALLPPGSDAVRRLPVRGTWPSTLTCFSPTSKPLPREGLQPRYSGLRVQGTASSPPSATGRIQSSTGFALRSCRGAHSSAGERPLHTREVPGSIPGAPTEPAGARRGNRLIACHVGQLIVCTGTS